MLRFSAILLHSFTLAMHCISCHGIWKNIWKFFFFLEQRATTETEIFLQVIVACYFLPFCLFLFTFGQKELIQSQIYTMQRYYYKSRLPDWGQSLEELVREMKAPGNQLLTRAIM